MIIFDIKMEAVNGPHFDYYFKGRQINVVKL